MEINKFYELFSRKPIIGMIHLAGKGHEDRVKRALEELVIFDEEGFDGAVIEDYFGNYEDVSETLLQSSSIGLNLIRGVNILRNP